MTGPLPGKGWWTLHEVATLLSTTYTSLAKLANTRNGVIVTDMHGAPIVTAYRPEGTRRWLVPRSDVDRLLNPSPEPPEPQPEPKELSMPIGQQPPVRANLTVGPVKCEVRTPEPLTAEQWSLVSALAQAVRDTAAKLEPDSP